MPQSRRGSICSCMFPGRRADGRSDLSYPRRIAGLLLAHGYESVIEAAAGLWFNGRSSGARGEGCGLDFPGLLARVCIARPGGADAGMGRARAGGVNGLSETMKKVSMSEEVVPPRFDWYQEPRQIFDNFYWVGIKRNSAWVIKTSQG